jgi:hypothetical protein
MQRAGVQALAGKGNRLRPQLGPNCLRVDSQILVAKGAFDKDLSKYCHTSDACFPCPDSTEYGRLVRSVYCVRALAIPAPGLFFYAMLFQNFEGGHLPVTALVSFVPKVWPSTAEAAQPADFQLAERLPAPAQPEGLLPELARPEALLPEPAQPEAWPQARAPSREAVPVRPVALLVQALLPAREPVLLPVPASIPRQAPGAVRLPRWFRSFVRKVDKPR